MKPYRAELIVNNEIVDYIEFDAKSREVAFNYSLERFKNAYPIQFNNGFIWLKQCKQKEEN